MLRRSFGIDEEGWEDLTDDESIYGGVGIDLEETEEIKS